MSSDELYETICYTLYNIHNKLVVGDITLECALDIIEEFKKVNDLIELYSNTLIKENNSIKNINKKKLKEILFTNLAIIVLAPIAPITTLILCFYNLTKNTKTLNSLIKNPKNDEIQKKYDYLMNLIALKTELYGLKILKMSNYPLPSDEDKKFSLSGDAINALEFIYDIIKNNHSDIPLNERQKQIVIAIAKGQREQYQNLKELPNPKILELTK